MLALSHTPRLCSLQGSPGNRGFPGADGAAGPKVSIPIPIEYDTAKHLIIEEWLSTMQTHVIFM